MEAYYWPHLHSNIHWLIFCDVVDRHCVYRARFVVMLLMHYKMTCDNY
jgi:hypothetical protein